MKDVKAIKDDKNLGHIQNGFQYRCKDPCLNCGAPGEKYCLGDTGKKYNWGMFCLKCEPFKE